MSSVVCSFEVEQDLATILALVHVSLRVGDFLETPDAVNDRFDVSTLEHRFFFLFSFVIGHWCRCTHRYGPAGHASGVTKERKPGKKMVCFISFGGGGGMHRPGSKKIRFCNSARQ